MAAQIWYTCRTCNQWSSYDEHTIAVHLSKQHNICWSAANPCMQQFSSRQELVRHWMLTSHCSYCHICDGGCRSKEHLADHVCTPRTDAIIGGIRCPVCDMMAPNQEAYDRHFEDTAQDSRHFRCTQCYRIFAEENALRMVCFPNFQHAKLTLILLSAYASPPSGNYHLLSLPEQVLLPL